MNSIKPIHYEIKVIPNFGDFTFIGKTVLDVESDLKLSKITLNAVDLTFESISLVTTNNKTTLTYKIDENEEELYIDFPKEISGKFKLDFEYEGKIKNNLKGLYQTKYNNGSEKHIGAITQFETEDARRMFPCFDEPGMKATFKVEVETDEKLSVISNTPIESEEKLPNGKKRVVFSKTPKMSTYLLMLGIAYFENIEDKLGDITVRVLTHPGLIQYGKQALDFGVKSLDYCQKYFDVPYPLPKMDLIATPDFAAGAMENWGAITFRENDLLNFPGHTTKVQENRILGVIAHEITHQWFGNLVSPSVWKYIWLNESFASFFGYKIVADYYPELKLWDNVVGRMTNMALLADGYHQTVPIEIDGQKKTSYNIKSIPIIYSKGSAMLRMVHDFVGPDFFQKGLQIYLKKHAYDVASSNHLWEALEEASKMPVSKLMQKWVLQPGYPLLSVSRDGTKLTFKQKRFTYLENNDSTLWIVPISILVFTDADEPVKKKFLLESKEDTFDVGFTFKSFKVNADFTGFFRVSYSSEDLEVLGSMVKEGKLSTLDSWSIVNDLFALLKANKIDLDLYLKFVTNYTSEKVHTAITAISNQLSQLHNLAEGFNKSKIATQGIQFHESMLDKIGYSEHEQESYLSSILRNTILLNGSYLGSQKITEFCLKEFESYKQGKDLPANIKDAILSVGARQTNDFKWFMDKFDSANNEAEIVSLGAVMGEFSNDEVIDKVLDEVVFSKIPMRNVSTLIARLCENPYAINKMWKYFIANLDNFGRLHRSMFTRSLNSVIVNSVNEDTKKDMIGFFKEFNKTNPVAKITTEKSFETLEINLNLKNKLKI